MKYIFFGTPNFAAVILNRLIEAGMPPAAVVCNPDKPVGRKKILTKPPTKIIAEQHNIPVWQPESLEIRNWELEIEKLGGVDFAVVAAYGKILRPEFLNSLPAKFIGVHPSLLPKYRGATPIQSAILNDEKKTGATLFLIDEKVDHGPIIARRETRIANRNYQELEKELAEIGANLLIGVLLKLKQSSGNQASFAPLLPRDHAPQTGEEWRDTIGSLKRPRLLGRGVTGFAEAGFPPIPQNETEATYTKKFKSENGFVDLKKDDPKLIYRKILALNPEPGVYTIINGKRVKLLEADLADSKLKLKKIQIEGKKPTTKLSQNRVWGIATGN